MSNAFNLQLMWSFVFALITFIISRTILKRLNVLPPYLSSRLLKYGLMNLQSQDRGVVIGGKAHVGYREMRKCCWPAYLTVMYDAERIGRMFTRNQGANNDYALWLNVCERADCHLLDECLATMRTPWGLLGKLLLTQKFKWRYDSFRVEEDLGPVKALLYTIRNGAYGLVKWMKYVERV